jgi:hypothetical protein
MTHENCKLGDVQRVADGWGFNILNKRNRPLVTLAYPTEAEAKWAHGVMARVITGASVTPQPA